NSRRQVRRRRRRLTSESSVFRSSDYRKDRDRGVIANPKPPAFPSSGYIIHGGLEPFQKAIYFCFKTARAMMRLVTRLRQRSNFVVVGGETRRRVSPRPHQRNSACVPVCCYNLGQIWRVARKAEIGTHVTCLCVFRCASWCWPREGTAVLLTCFVLVVVFVLVAWVWVAFGLGANATAGVPGEDRHVWICVSGGVAWGIGVGVEVLRVVGFEDRVGGDE